MDLQLDGLEAFPRALHGGGQVLEHDVCLRAPGLEAAASSGEVVRESHFLSHRFVGFDFARPLVGSVTNLDESLV